MEKLIELGRVSAETMGNQVKSPDPSCQVNKLKTSSID